MTDTDDWGEPEEPKPITREVRQPVRPAAPNLGRELPINPEAEKEVIGACLVEGSDTLERCGECGLTDLSFHMPANRVIYQTLCAIRKRGDVLDLPVLAQELMEQRALDAVGGMSYLMELTQVQTSIRAGYFIEKVRQAAGKREIIARATALVEHAYNGDTLEEVQRAAEGLTGINTPRTRLTGKSLNSFGLPGKSDGSVLIGDRYLSKGDGAILCSTSGMGKSSFSIQAATSWALGQPMFGGFQPSRPLKSLIFQSEDSEGDIAEVKLSLFHAMKLDDKQVAQVGENVVIVTDRVHRGDAFITELKRQIGLHKPDLVWINPLLAFIGGDVNDAHEAGKFLREGLNSLNEPAQFAYIVVHHTSKPPKEKTDRKWNEVMYDMAGSADLTNWARAIISLRPGDQEGRFNLVLAKRGRRAGFTREKKGKITTFMEPVTTISVKHATDRFTPEDGYEMPVIHWSICEDVVESAGPGGRQRVAKLDKFIHVFGIGIDNSIGFRPMLRAAQEIQPTLSNTAFYNMLDAATEAGSVMVDKRNPRQPKYYVERPNVEPMFKE